jgi:hypothetical protein
MVESHAEQSTSVTGMADNRPGIVKSSLPGSFSDACPKEHIKANVS